MDEVKTAETTVPSVARNASIEKTGGLRDVAADLFLEVGQYSPEELHSERAAVRKKLDLIIMPL